MRTWLAFKRFHQRFLCWRCYVTLMYFRFFQWFYVQKRSNPTFGQNKKNMKVAVAFNIWYHHRKLQLSYVEPLWSTVQACYKLVDCQILQKKLGAHTVYLFDKININPKEKEKGSVLSKNFILVYSRHGSLGIICLLIILRTNPTEPLQGHLLDTGLRIINRIRTTSWYYNNTFRLAVVFLNIILYISYIIIT